MCCGISARKFIGVHDSRITGNGLYKDSCVVSATNLLKKPELASMKKQ